MRKLYMFLSLLVMVFCLVFIMRNVNFKNIYLVILIMASIYFGVLYKTKGKDDKKEGVAIPPPLPNSHSEFSGEQDNFEKLNERGMFS